MQEEGVAADGLDDDIEGVRIDAHALALEEGTEGIPDLGVGQEAEVVVGHALEEGGARPAELVRHAGEPGEVDDEREVVAEALASRASLDVRHALRVLEGVADLTEGGVIDVLHLVEEQEQDAPSILREPAGLDEEVRERSAPVALANLGWRRWPGVHGEPPGAETDAGDAVEGVAHPRGQGRGQVVARQRLRDPDEELGDDGVAAARRDPDRPVACGRRVVGEVGEEDGLADAPVAGDESRALVLPQV